MEGTTTITRFAMVSILDGLDPYTHFKAPHEGKVDSSRGARCHPVCLRKGSGMLLKPHPSGHTSTPRPSRETPRREKGYVRFPCLSFSPLTWGRGTGTKAEQDLAGRIQMRTLFLLLLGMRKATGHKLVIDTKMCGTQIVCIVNVGVCRLCI